jgi:hypothetical protein
MACAKTNPFPLTDFAALPQNREEESHEGNSDRKTKRVKALIQGKNGLKLVMLNRRKAIRERCLNCTCWCASEVRNCDFTECPLHPFRLGSGRQDPQARKKAIWRFCRWCSGGSVKEVPKCPSRDCPLYAYRMSALDRNTGC